MFFAHHGTAAGTSSAVRGGKRLVQIQVKHIDSHLAGAGITHEGIEIGAVHIDEATLLVDNLGDLLDMGFKDPHGIGVGQHQAGHLLAHLFGQYLDVDSAFLVGWDGDHLISSQNGAGRIGSVGRIGNQDELSRASFLGKMGADHQDTDQFRLGSSGRLQTHRIHGGQLLEALLKPEENFQAPLAVLFLLKGMGQGDTGDTGDSFVQLGIVLHGAGA